MTSILFLKDAIHCKIFTYIYLRTEKYFLNLFLDFLNLDSILNFFKKQMTLFSVVYLNLRTPKYVVR